MTDEIPTGLTHEFTYTVPDSKVISELFPESEEFAEMPDVFASGFYIGLIEWACIEMLNPYLDWPAEQTVGTHMDISHEAPTPPGTDVTVETEVTAVEGRQITIDVTAHDEIERIGGGTHTRFLIDRDQFAESVENKRQ